MYLLNLGGYSLEINDEKNKSEGNEISDADIYENDREELSEDTEYDTLTESSPAIEVETPPNKIPKIYKTDCLSEILNDEDGNWCTIKYAAQATGLSISTLRRRVTDKYFRTKAIKTSYGVTNYIFMEDLKKLEAAQRLAVQNKELGKESLVSALSQFFEVYESEKLVEVNENINKVMSQFTEMRQENQEMKATIDAMKQEQEKIMEQLIAQKAQNDVLLEKINTQEEEQNRGFWGKLFKKSK